MEDSIITLSRAQLHTIIKEATRQAIREHESQKARHSPEHLYNRNQAARTLGKSFTTITRMIQEGRITATADGKFIAQKELDRYITST